MTNQNSNHRGTQMTDLSVMISRCFFYNNMKHPGVPETSKREKWSQEDIKNVSHSYLKSNSTQRIFRKRVIEIWLKSDEFNAKNQRLTDQVSMI